VKANKVLEKALLTPALVVPMIAPFSKNTTCESGAVLPLMVKNVLPTLIVTCCDSWAKTEK
jgi:hypothetical protein